MVSKACFIAAIEATFAKDYAHDTVTPTNGADLVWSPTNSQTSLLAIINDAKTSLLVENEEMSDSAIVSALESAAKKLEDIAARLARA